MSSSDKIVTLRMLRRKNIWVFSVIDLIHLSKLFWFSAGVWVIQLYVLFYSHRFSQVRYFSFDCSYSCALLPNLSFTDFLTSKICSIAKDFIAVISVFSSLSFSWCNVISFLWYLVSVKVNCDSVLHITEKETFVLI